MGRRLRCLLAGHLVEITCRTIQGRFLLRPSSQVNLAIKGILGRAQRYFGLRVVICVFLSNHYHLLVLPDSEQQLAAFMQFLNTNLSKQLGRLHDWQGPLLQRRYQAIPVSHELPAGDLAGAYGDLGSRTAWGVSPCEGTHHPGNARAITAAGLGGDVATEALGSRSGSRQ